VQPTRLLVAPWLSALAALLALAALACVGCSKPLGMNDVELSYRTTGAPPSDLDQLVGARLASAEITADVRKTAEGVAVTVDRETSGSVDRLLAWPGGLAVYDKVTKLKPGEHARALTAPDGSTVQVATMALDLHDAVQEVTVTPDGRSITVRLTPDGDARLAGAGPAHTDVAIALDREALYVGPLVPAPFTFSFGDDLEAYARARATRLVLSSPVLPPLTRTEAVAAPANLGLAALAVVLPFVLSLAWLFFVRRFDRAQPEPWSIVAATFMLGGASVVPAALAEVGWSRLSPWLDPSLATMGGRIVALPLALPVFALVVGLSEEGAKLLGAWSLAFHRREFDEPVDGIVYGSASALGFAAIENVKYFAVGRLDGALVATRMFVTLPAHIFFGAIWGYALGRKLIDSRTPLLAYLVLAAIVHGAFDACLSVDHLAPAAFALNLALASTFVVLLRKSLRHGVVTDASLHLDPKRRELFAVGAPVPFALAVVSLHIVAALLFLGFAYAQGSHWHMGWLFFTSMSSAVVLLALCAYFVTTTMPLDAVLDDYGVTFAGAARSWATIRGVQPSPRGVHLRSTEGDVWIGPAPRPAVDAIVRALQARSFIAAKAGPMGAGQA
jgi:RsiW-degrading membrane proteinase PrsW (M82 family)